jgi:threonine dehydratase
MTRLLGLADVQAAFDRIQPWVRQTPVMAVTSEVSGLDGADVLLKLELLQRTGTFKARGAFNAMLSAPVPAAGVVAASGGNHGAAVAYAAMRLGCPATIFVPETAPRAKLDRLRQYGATVRQIGQAYADAFAAAQDFLAGSGARLIHAYDDPVVVAGQGSVALEFLNQAGGQLDTVLVAVGGGGLIGGVIAALREQSVRVVAIESEGTPTLARALAAGHPVQVPVSGIAASALGASVIGENGFAQAQSHLHAMILVTDAEIEAAQHRLWDEVRLITEPGGAVALAALTSGRYIPEPGERIGVIVCGSNADLASFLPAA